MLIISDTTPVISLMKINRLYLLQDLFQEIWIPEAVYRELTENDNFPEEAHQINECSFLHVKAVTDQILVETLMTEKSLDLGESEAIALACEHRTDLLLMDEKRARRIAEQMGIPKTGTIGVLLQAFDEHMMSAEEVDECIQLLKNTNIRVSKSLCDYTYAYIRS